MCHDLLQDPRFFDLLLRIDAVLAEQVRAAACPYCGGPLHLADYPRKPRACLLAFHSGFSSRHSFCCGLCRRRTTPPSVRFLGRRVYLGLAVVLLSTRYITHISNAGRLSSTLGVSLRSLERWRQWWQQDLPQTDFWHVFGAYFMPPPDWACSPASLLRRFQGGTASALRRLLMFLRPLTSRSVNLAEGR